MNLNRKSFTYRLYSWCHILKSKLWNEDPTNYNGDIIVRTSNNLCPMMRTIFLWTPVYLLTFLALLGGIGYIFFYLPNTYGGTVGYMNTYLIPGVVIGLIAAFIYGIVQFVKWHDNRPYNPGETVEEMEARHAAGNYTFWEMICNYVRAVHEKTCPMIAIVEDVKPEPAPEPEKAAPGQPVPTPPEDPQDIKTGPDEVDTPEVVGERSEAAAKAVDDMIEELDKLDEPVKQASNKNNSVDVRFLNKFAPNFKIFIAVACAMGVVAFLNWMMASVMQTHDVVFEKAQCVASFDVEKRDGIVTCGEFVKTDQESVAFLADTLVLKKAPYCKVTKGSLTDSIKFDCEYK